MRDLLIFGTYGVHYMEMIEIVERVNRAEPMWNLLGLITADEKDVGETRSGVRVIGMLDDIDKYPGAALIPAYGWDYTTELPMDRLASLIDPSAFVSNTAEIGLGCVLYPNCFVGLRARLGNFVFSLSGSVINHDDVLEDRVTLASRATLAGSVYVEADSYLGQSCTVRQYLRIGRGSLIGHGAVVCKDVEPNSVMVGNPARKLRDVK